MGVIGRSVRRLEDERLLLGRGRFCDNVDLPGQLWMRVVRSPVAHARIRRVGTVAAVAQPGVARVVTADDFETVPRIPVRQVVPGHDLSPYLQPALACGFVRYVGEPVAAVLAEDPYVAEDAAELVDLDLAELPVALDAQSAAEQRPESWRGSRCHATTVEIGRASCRERVFAVV